MLFRTSDLTNNAKIINGRMIGCWKSKHPMNSPTQQNRDLGKAGGCGEGEANSSVQILRPSFEDFFLNFVSLTKCYGSCIKIAIHISLVWQIANFTFC